MSNSKSMVQKISAVCKKAKKYNFITLFSLVLVLMVILVSTNYANSQSLSRDQLSQEIKYKQDQIRLLSAQVSELQTSQRVEQESQRLNLVKTQSNNIYYLSDQDERVALK